MCGAAMTRLDRNTCSPECAFALVKKNTAERRAREKEERILKNTITKVCEHCGESFTYLRGPGSERRFCSDRCGKKNAKLNRAARKRGAYVADVHFAHIYKRDGGICQICGGAVDKSAKAPHPLSPSLDHIVPLAVGGTHEPANVQLAHFLCNSLKSDDLDLPTDFAQTMRHLLASHTLPALDVAAWQQALLFG
jgi:hypothetical protein